MERLTGCSAVGSALGSGPRGRGFKSPHSDQKSTGFNKKPVDLFYIPDAIKDILPENQCWIRE